MQPDQPRPNTRPPQVTANGQTGLPCLQSHTCSMSEGRHKPQVHGNRGVAHTRLREVKPLVTGSRQSFGHLQELVVGAQQFSQMFVVALTIVTGIMIGYTIVRPEPTL